VSASESLADHAEIAEMADEALRIGRVGPFALNRCLEQMGRDPATVAGGRFADSFEQRVAACLRAVGT
jgi:hypothetical protein